MALVPLTAVSIVDLAEPAYLDLLLRRVVALDPDTGAELRRGGARPRGGVLRTYWLRAPAGGGWPVRHKGAVVWLRDAQRIRAATDGEAIANAERALGRVRPRPAETEQEAE